jgi:HPt (histidine-containing phosphotransfer) domain-containing protein
MTAASIFDLPFALSQLSHNKALLIKLLEKFSTDYANVKLDLENDVVQGQFKSAKDKAHMLKGVAGNLGMQALQQACRELERPLNKHTCDMNQIEMFKSVFEQTLLDVNQAIVELESPPQIVEELDNQSLKKQFIKKLQNYEFIPPDELDELLEKAVDNSNIDISALKRYVIDLEYDTALTLLHA